MAETQPIPNILIADDHAIIRTGMKYLFRIHFNISVTHEADSCSDLMEPVEGAPIYTRYS